jgi:hypothetical protein
MPSKHPRRKKPSRKIPYRNHSPHGWWIASYIARAAWDDEPKASPNSRCVAWKNTIVINAQDRQIAYKKALIIGRGHSKASAFWHPRTKRTGRWVFVGLTSLLPIYEALEDGAEILWTEYPNRTIRKIHSLAKKKHELEAFDDTPSEGDRPGPSRT